MVKKYFHMVGGCLLLMVIYTVSLTPLFALSKVLDQKQIFITLVIWFFLAAVLFLPALGVIIKKVWFFEGIGQPVVLDLLKAILIDINSENIPIIVKKTRKHFIITWRYDDPAWREHLELSGLKKIYELRLFFNNNTKTVIFSDRFRSINWNYSQKKVKTGWLAIPKPVFRVKTGVEWGIENYMNSEPDTYSFTPLEIKSPVLNTIIKNGWNVCFSIF